MGATVPTAKSLTSTARRSRRWRRAGRRGDTSQVNGAAVRRPGAMRLARIRARMNRATLNADRADGQYRQQAQSLEKVSHA